MEKTSPQASKPEEESLVSRHHNITESLIQEITALKATFHELGTFIKETGDQKLLQGNISILLALVREMKNNWIAECYELSHVEVQNILCALDEEDITAYKQYLHVMPYADYLITPHWQNMRQLALQRAGNHCQVCNTATTLNVHHRTYERRGYEEPQDLIVLCQSCHQLFHDNGKLERKP